MRNLKRADVVKGTTFGGKYSTGMLDATAKHNSVSFQCTNLQTGKSLKVKAYISSKFQKIIFILHDII